MSSVPYPWIVAAVAVVIAVSAGFAVLYPPPAPPATAADEDAAVLLIRLQSDITAALEALDGRLSHAAFDLGATDLNDTAARGILVNVSAASPAIIDAAASDASGTVLAVEPAAYRGIEGMDIRAQDHIRHILASKRPIMSEVFTVAEGFPAAVIATPVFTNESRFAGFASVAFRPDVLIAGIAVPATNATPFQVMVVQTDGRVLYDTDPSQIGRMTFDDPLYAESPGLLDVAHRVAAERYGTAAYAFTAGGETVQKEIIWTTAGLHGAEWRVAVIQEVG